MPFDAILIEFHTFLFVIYVTKKYLPKMHIHLNIGSVKQIKHPPWTSLNIIGERNKYDPRTNQIVNKYDLLLLDSKQFAVQAFSSKNSSKMIFTHFDAMSSIQDDIVQIFPTRDKNQASKGKYYLINHNINLRNIISVYN